MSIRITRTTDVQPTKTWRDRDGLHLEFSLGPVVLAIFFAAVFFLLFLLMVPSPDHGWQAVLAAIVVVSLAMGALTAWAACSVWKGGDQ